MTPRDYYIAAAVQGLLAREALAENICDGEGRNAAIAVEAVNLADALAAAACERWGHRYGRKSWQCKRCGEYPDCDECKRTKGPGENNCSCIPY